MRNMPHVVVFVVAKIVRQEVNLSCHLGYRGAIGEPKIGEHHQIEKGVALGDALTRWKTFFDFSFVVD